MPFPHPARLESVLAPPRRPASAWVLSWILVALSVASSLVGLLARGVYRDAEDFVRAGWLGNDAVTLTLAAPALAWGTWAASRGSTPGTMVWLGALDFMLYNYAFYLFGAAPNRLLLAYIALVGLSLVALVIGVVNLHPGRLPQPGRGPRRFLIGYMAAWAVALALLWSIPAGAFAWTGNVPDLNGSEHAFRVIAALDLTLVVPFVGLAAVLLARRSPWGPATAAILNVKGILYPAVLVASSYTAHREGVGGALALVPLWLAFIAASSLSTWLLLRRGGTAR